MTVLQVVALALVAVSGTLVVAARDPLRQAMVVGVFGLSLASLFLVFQAPDVALSQITVGTVALPILILFTLAKLREIEEDDDEEEAQ